MFKNYIFDGATSKSILLKSILFILECLLLIFGGIAKGRRRKIKKERENKEKYRKYRESNGKDKKKENR